MSEQNILQSHLSYEELLPILMARFEVDRTVAHECVLAIVTRTAYLNNSQWTMAEKDGAVLLIREDKGRLTERMYRLSAKEGERLDKATGVMVSQRYIAFERVHLRPAELTAQFSVGTNEVGHRLPPGATGRRR